MSTRVQSFPIANGYKISHDMNVFPPVTERYVKPVDGAKEPPKSIIDAIDNWDKIKDFVAKHNSIPSRDSGDPDEVKLHQFLMLHPNGYDHPRHTYITQDGVCRWSPVYKNSMIVGWVNNWTNQTVCGHVRPHDVQYSCVKSAATHATWIKPMSQNTRKKTTENKPGMGK